MDMIRDPSLYRRISEPHDSIEGLVAQSGRVVLQQVL